MSQERWDIVLRFLHGPLAYQADMVLRGPVVRIGANPGPATGGSSLKLEGYRGLDDRQAVITVYDGATVQVAPVGAHQVRTAPHEHVNWEELLPIRGPVFLSNGGAIHFGGSGWLECPRVDGLARLTDEITVAAWIRPRSAWGAQTIVARQIYHPGRDVALEIEREQQPQTTHLSQAKPRRQRG